METDWCEENGMEWRLVETEGRGRKWRTVEKKKGKTHGRIVGGTLHDGRAKEVHGGRAPSDFGAILAKKEQLNILHQHSDCQVLCPLYRVHAF